MNNFDVNVWATASTPIVRMLLIRINYFSIFPRYDYSLTAENCHIFLDFASSKFKSNNLKNLSIEYIHKYTQIIYTSFSTLLLYRKERKMTIKVRAMKANLKTTTERQQLTQPATLIALLSSRSAIRTIKRRRTRSSQKLEMKCRATLHSFPVDKGTILTIQL